MIQTYEKKTQNNFRPTINHNSKGIMRKDVIFTKTKYMKRRVLLSTQATFKIIEHKIQNDRNENILF